MIGIDFSVVNPFIIKKYSEMKMLRTKTDAVDSRLIAEFGFEQKPNLYEFPPKEQEQIFRLIKTMNRFQVDITRYNNRLHAEKESSVELSVISKEYKRIGLQPELDLTQIYKKDTINLRG